MLVTCSRCGAKKPLPEETLGRRIHCKRCDAVFRYAVEVDEPPSVVRLPPPVVETYRDVIPAPVEPPPIVVVRPEIVRSRGARSARQRQRDSHRAEINVVVTYVGLGLAALPLLGGILLSIEHKSSPSQLLCTLSACALAALPFLALAMWGGKR